MQLRLRSQSEEVDSAKGHGLYALQVRTVLRIPSPRSIQCLCAQAR